MKKQNYNYESRDQQKTESFEYFAWLVYKEDEKYINKHFEEFENLSERDETLNEKQQTLKAS